MSPRRPKRKPRARRRTKRELAARDALVDAATAVTCLTNGNTDMTFRLSSALADLWLANDEWQRAQLAAFGTAEDG